MTMPLYRDPDAKVPNITLGFLDQLSKAYGFAVAPEDLASYIYALLGGQSYTQRFWNELETRGPRVPITKDGPRFQKIAELGRRLVWLHTYGERLEPRSGSEQIPAGTTKALMGIPTKPENYPEHFEYLSASKEVVVGDGRFGPVAPEIWEFQVSGLKVVQSWLAYRMKERAGKKSSPLDDVRPEQWTARMTDEFLELLWVLEGTLEMEPKLAAILDSVVSGPCFKESELPKPSDAERKAPKRSEEESTDQLSMLDDDDEDGKE
jgi:hypothetical protein